MWRNNNRSSDLSSRRISRGDEDEMAESRFVNCFSASVPGRPPRYAIRCCCELRCNGGSYSAGSNADTIEGLGNVVGSFEVKRMGVGKTIPQALQIHNKVTQRTLNATLAITLWGRKDFTEKTLES